MSFAIKTLSTFTLLFAFAATSGCSTTPPNLDLSRDKLSEGSRCSVAVIAPTPTPAINQLHSWKVSWLHLTGTRQGSAVRRHVL